MIVRNKSPLNIHVALFAYHDSKKGSLILKINMLVKQLSKKWKSCYIEQEWQQPNIAIQTSIGEIELSS